jgi:hypothetical protein
MVDGDGLAGLRECGGGSGFSTAFAAAYDFEE